TANVCTAPLALRSRPTRPPLWYALLLSSAVAEGLPMSIRAVFLDHASLDLGDLDFTALRDCFDELTLHDASETAQVSERLQGATVAITNKVRLDAEVFTNCPELKLVLISATGTNNVDLDAARAHGVTVCNCQGYGTPSVAQHCLMLLLALATRLPDYHAAVRAGRWQQAKQFCLLD